MEQPQQPVQIGGAGFRALISAAALVIVLAGVQAAQDVLLPMVIAVFLSILCMPALRGLQRIGVPKPLAIAMVVILVAGILVGVTGILASTVRAFTAQAPKYEAPLRELLQTTLAQAQAIGIETPAADQLTELVRPDAVLALVGQTLNAVIAVLSRVVIVTVTMTFILFEATELAHKSSAAFGDEAGMSFGQAPMQVSRYLIIKSGASLVTGGIVGVSVSLLGLDFAMMWGLIAFLLNYIPTIGSIVAAVPPVLLAIVQLGWLKATVVMGIYLATNIAIGNFLEPRLLGRTLGLSPLVVFLSLLFWGWLWGPAGMLFCVPLTVIAKLIMEGNEDTRWIAIFLGSGRDVLDYERRMAEAEARKKAASKVVADERDDTQG